MECLPFDPTAAVKFRDRGLWDVAAPELLSQIVRRWELTLGPARTDGVSGVVHEVAQLDGTAAILKLGYPHEEAIFEAVTLQAFPEGRAPAVLRQDPAGWAMLLECIEPGTALNAADLPVDEALDAGGRLLAGLFSGSTLPRFPLPKLSETAASGAALMLKSIARHESRLEEYGIPIPVLQDAANELARLAGLSAPNALLHGDANPGNILLSDAGGPQRWVAIDPKGLIGDPAYDLWPLVTQLGDPLAAADPVTRLSSQLAIAASAAGCDPARAAQWAFARAGQSTLWFVEDADRQQAQAEARVMLAWQGVARG